MNIALWIAAGLLAAQFVLAGFTKLVKSRQELVDAGQGWAAEFPPAAVKFIGLSEVLGAVGVILPGALGIAPILVPTAAAALAVLMIGAAITHLKRGENSMLITNTALFILAAFVAWGRFGNVPF